ncbi:3-isopropylmalate dehydratase small subunit [Methanomassiliicoccus luminyensis]|uniref:3-isopropylmalate dehydratase small subunit n=1 Tax=Methanomassiliicoccus luminyensis TaxID=1080712 RepID=UPI00038052F7|nr:3-isopropylmalate dehydratase small subunit [Methanomassiliicoccus luminyensis]
MISGKVWKYGDHVNTDLIIPGRYLDDYNVQNLAKHAMEDIDPTFAAGVRKGDIIVAARNFGCGSSREQAPLALKAAGVGAVIAGSAARIFYRNSINVGLPIVICPQAAGMFEGGDPAEVDLEAGTVRNARTGSCVNFNPPPEFLLDILNDGGLVPHMRKKLGTK